MYFVHDVNIILFTFFTVRNLDLYHTLRLMVNGRTLQERRWGLRVLFPLYLSSNSRNQLFLPLTQGTDSSILPTSTPDPLHQEQRAIRTGHFHAIVPYLTKELEAKVGWGNWLVVSIWWFCSIQHNALSLFAMIFFHNYFLSYSKPSTSMATKVTFDIFKTFPQISPLIPSAKFDLGGSCSQLFGEGSARVDNCKWHKAHQVKIRF